MSRHRFRSQPALQRSNGGAAPSIIGLCLIAAVGVSLGTLGGAWLKDVAQDSLLPRAAQPAARPAVATAAPAPDLARPADAAPTPPPALENPEALASAAPVVRVKARPAAKPAHRTQPPVYAAVRPLTPQQQWERQRVDYELAQAAYDANERKEGYRWAEENRLRTPRYCRAAQQRTAAFMEGCLSYLRPGRAKPPGPADQPDSSPDRG